MKPNYLKFRSDVLSTLKPYDVKNTCELDSLDTQEVALTITETYDIPYVDLVDLLYEDMPIDEFVKASYKLIKE